MNQFSEKPEDTLETVSPEVNAEDIEDTKVSSNLENQERPPKLTISIVTEAFDLAISEDWKQHIEVHQHGEGVTDENHDQIGTESLATCVGYVLYIMSNDQSIKDKVYVGHFNSMPKGMRWEYEEDQQELMKAASEGRVFRLILGGEWDDGASRKMAHDLSQRLSFADSAAGRPGTPIFCGPGFDKNANNAASMMRASGVCINVRKREIRLLAMRENRKPESQELIDYVLPLIQEIFQ